MAAYSLYTNYLCFLNVHHATQIRSRYKSDKILWLKKKMHACIDLSILQQIISLSAAVRHQHLSIWEARVLCVWDAREPKARIEALRERKCLFNGNM